MTCSCRSDSSTRARRRRMASSGTTPASAIGWPGSGGARSWSRRPSAWWTSASPCSLASPETTGSPTSYLCWPNTLRRLAAELQRDPLEVVGRCPHNDLADLDEPGEGDLVDVGMPGERRAGRLAEPGDDVDDAVRQAGLEQQLAEAQRRERGLLGDLENDGATRGERGGELPGRHQQREVPGDDLPDDADRLEAGGREEIGARGGERRDRDRLALELRRPAGHVVEHVGRQGYVCGLGHGLRLAVVDGFERGEFVRVLQDQVADLVQEASARRRRHARPGAALEGATGGLHGEIDIGLIAFGDTGDNLAGRRVRNLEGLARPGGDPFAVDKKVALVGQPFLDCGRDARRNGRDVGTDVHRWLLPKIQFFGDLLQRGLDRYQSHRRFRREPELHGGGH